MSKPVRLLVTPRRVQLSRRKGFRLPPNTVSVARPSKWGNPYKLSLYDVRNADDSPVSAVELKREARSLAVRDHWGWLRCFPEGEKIAAQARVELRGKNLACWCPLDAECHADNLIEIANEVANG
jgi:hypothetical protein